MAERKVKCPQCGEWFLRSQVENVEHKDRHYHKICYDILLKEENEKEKLYKYILKIFKSEGTRPGPRILGQIKNFMAEYGYSYRSIHMALAYWYGVKENTTEKSNGGIGIVPFIHDEAKTYFEEIERNKKKAEGIARQLKQGEAKVIVVAAPVDKVTQRRNQQIDLSELEE